MRVTISTIPHFRQRYPTVGDWWADSDGDAQIRVSKLDHWHYRDGSQEQAKCEFLVALHEFIEMQLCRFRGIREEDVTAFDKAFEEERAKGQHGHEEPGDHPFAPYHQEHAFATNIERLVAHELRVDWETYESALEAL